ncbi:MAG: hypothetical protein HQL53_10335 [Magnetococcales bacterium]|nr:hypothetical protein [Magnetococcales bacterium]
MNWKLGSPTPEIRAYAMSLMVKKMTPEQLDAVPVDLANDLTRTEMASAFYQGGQLKRALDTLKMVLDGPRDDERMMLDYWVARYAEWLVEDGRAEEAESFLMDEYDEARGVSTWQVAQKLAAFFLDQGDPDQAEIWVDVSLKGDVTNPFTYYLKGLLMHSMDRWDEAIESYEESLSQSDRYPEQERKYMAEMVESAMKAARNHESVDAEEESGDND